MADSDLSMPVVVDAPPTKLLLPLTRRSDTEHFFRYDGYDENLKKMNIRPINFTGREVRVKRNYANVRFVLSAKVQIVASNRECRLCISIDAY